jgi:drug/metabolite transporter (DMT)-like permease
VKLPSFQGKHASTGFSIALRPLDLYLLYTPAGAGFTFPTLYTLVTSIASLLGCTFVLSVQRHITTLSWAQFQRSWTGILMVSFLMVLSIWASDASLMYIGVTLNQILKATMPMPTMAFGYFFEHKRFTWQMVLAVAFIVIGAALAVPFSSPDATPYGLLMALLSTLAAAACISIKATLMANSKENGLTPLVLLWYSSAIAAPALTLMFVLTPELIEAGEYMREKPEQTAWILATASVLAFMVNLSGNTLTKITSALTVTIAGSTKQIAVILVSAILIEHTFKSALNVVGAITFILALIAYAYMAYSKTLKPKVVVPPRERMQRAVRTVVARGSVARRRTGTDSLVNAALAAQANEKTPLRGQSSGK